MSIGRFAAILPLWISVTASLALGQRPGLLRGMVVEENGTPLAAALVIADPMDSRPALSPVIMAETDKEGHFVIGNLALGSYKVFAKKESAGYPDTSFAFYSNHVFPTVTLTDDVPQAEMLLKVGPPAGVIKGTVRNAVTGDPVSATFILRRAPDPDNWISMSQRPDYGILAPPGVDVLLEVSAPGYQSWYYSGPSDPLRRVPIRLKSGEEMKLDVKLEPDDKPEKR